MADEIRMSPEQMQKRANEYKKEAGNIGETIKRLDNLLKALEGEWKGDSSKAFSAKYAELRPIFVKGQALSDEIAEALLKAKQIIEEQDRAIAGQFTK